MISSTNELIGQPIRSLQTMLRTIAQYDNNILSVIPDGIYSDNTTAAVLSFQKQHGLPTSGVTDIETWNAIVAEYRRISIEIRPAAPVEPVFQQGQVIYAQEVNMHLYMIHGMLLAISDYFPSMPRVSCNNIHDEISVAAIRWLQIRAGIEPTGNINRSTWRHLTKLYRITIGDGTFQNNINTKKEKN